MRTEQLIADLQNLTKQRITQKDLGDALGISKQAIGNKKADNYEFAEYEVEKITNYVLNKYNSNECTLIDNSEHVILDYYPDIEVSCGNGIIPFGETKEKMTVPVSLIKGYSKNKKYVIVNATSDSMQPEIKPNDMLIIRVTDTDTIIDNHIYVFCYEDRLYCKYLSYNVNQIIVRSANKDYPTRFIEKENINDFRLCGEVCGHFRSYLR